MVVQYRHGWLTFLNTLCFLSEPKLLSPPFRYLAVTVIYRPLSLHPDTWPFIFYSLSSATVADPSLPPPSTTLSGETLWVLSLDPSSFTPIPLHWSFVPQTLFNLVFAILCSCYPWSLIYYSDSLFIGRFGVLYRLCGKVVVIRSYICGSKVVLYPNSPSSG